MPIPDFVLDLRAKVGPDLLWLPGVSAVIRHPERAELLLVKRADNGAWTPDESSDVRWWAVDALPPMPPHMVAMV